MAIPIQAVVDISDFMGLSQPFSSVNLPKLEIDGILDQLQKYKRPENFRSIGERPNRRKYVSEFKTGYRGKLSAYIYENTSIQIPVDSNTTASFYDAVADFLGL